MGDRRESQVEYYIFTSEIGMIPLYTIPDLDGPTDAWHASRSSATRATEP